MKTYRDPEKKKMATEIERLKYQLLRTTEAVEAADKRIEQLGFELTCERRIHDLVMGSQIEEVAWLRRLLALVVVPVGKEDATDALTKQMEKHLFPDGKPMEEVKKKIYG